ncbi:MAG: MGMT family protein [Patescibacteria group bacterium]
MTEFEKKVLNIIKKIPAGRVTTYKHLAKAIGRPKACRAVGNALNKNPWAPKVPCHRVVKSDGKIGGYAHGVSQKMKLLKKEGIVINKGKIIDFNKILFNLR